jgi:hypothetical protein
MVANLVFFRQRALLIALVAFVVVLVLWNVPQLAFIVYPIRLFVTFVHESGHGLAALISGGHFEEFRVFPNGAGVALTGGGSRLLILPAGYLGSALFGALLFYIANTVPFPRTISLILAILVAAITLLFTEILSTGWLVGLGFALALLALWRYADRSVNLLVLDVLAILTGLNVVLDLFALVRHSDASMGAVLNDAAAFSREVAPVVPGAVWAALWALTAIALLILSVYLSHVRRRRIL